MVLLFALRAPRHDLQEVDRRFIAELGEKGIPFGIIFTKADKQGPDVLNAQILKNKGLLLQEWESLPPTFVSSSVSGEGKTEILNYIGQILQNL